MNREIIATDAAPKAVGPYSQGVKTGNLVFFSGQIALDPASGTMVGETVEAQAEQVLKNVMGLLESQGLTAQNLVKTTVFLKDIGDFKKVNEIYAKYMEEPFPARSAFAVADLPLGALVEIECIATQ